MLIYINTHWAALRASFTIIAFITIFNSYIKTGSVNKSPYFSAKRYDWVDPASPMTKAPSTKQEDKKEDENNHRNVGKKVTDI